jgi:hypothetical protein
MMKARSTREVHSGTMQNGEGLTTMIGLLLLLKIPSTNYTDVWVACGCCRLGRPMPPAAEAVICGIQLIQKIQNAYSLVAVGSQLTVLTFAVNFE